MRATRATRAQLAAALLVLVVLHFYIRPRLWTPRVSPDFLLIALTLFAMRGGPGAGAAAGLLTGLASDALNPARFGAGALAHTVVGYLAAWGRGVFFADNVMILAAFVAAGAWLRDLILLVASGTDRGHLFAELTLYSPVQALTTAGFAALVLLAFRQWLAIRLDA